MVVNETQIPGTKIELYSTLLDTLAFDLFYAFVNLYSSA
jgi:hypothetical protein